MEDTKIVPQWMLDVLQVLHNERDKLQTIYDQREAVAETARRACVPVQQQLEKVKDAIRSLSNAVEWAGGTAWEVPF